MNHLGGASCGGRRGRPGIGSGRWDRDDAAELWISSQSAAAASEAPPNPSPPLPSPYPLPFYLCGRALLQVPQQTRLAVPSSRPPRRGLPRTPQVLRRRRSQTRGKGHDKDRFWAEPLADAEPMGRACKPRCGADRNARKPPSFRLPSDAKARIRGVHLAEGSSSRTGHG